MPYRTLIFFFAIAAICWNCCRNDSSNQPSASTPALDAPSLATDEREIAGIQSEKDVLQRVKSRLWQTVRDQYKVQPVTLQWGSADSLVAEYQPGINGLPARILVGKLAFEHLEKVHGTPAAECFLAQIVGHELGHHVLYETSKVHKCAYVAAFGYSGDVMTPGDEAYCDRFGAFSAYLAGYRLSGIMPQMIHTLYERFNLKNISNQYLPEEERAAIGSETEAVLKELSFLFQCAGPLASAGFHREAALAYKTVAQYYPGKEILTNLGANLFLSVLQDDKNEQFAYPAEIIWESRLQEATGTMGGALNMTEAIRVLQEALELDASYYPARLNLICAYAKMGNVAAVRSHIDLLGNHQQTSIQAAAKTALALAFAKSKDSLQADQIFSMLANDPAIPPEIRQMVGHNLTILRHVEVMPTLQAPAWPGNLKLPPLVDFPDRPAKSFPLQETISLDSVNWGEAGSVSGSFRVNVPGKKPRTVFMALYSPKPFSKYQWAAIRDVPNLRKILTNNGWVTVFSKEKLGFRFDKEGALLGWFRFCVD